MIDFNYTAPELLPFRIQEVLDAPSQPHRIGDVVYVPQGCEEIVRCMDCKHFKMRNGIGLCKRWKYFSIVSKPDDFCSRAERQDA